MTTAEVVSMTIKLKSTYNVRALRVSLTVGKLWSWSFLYHASLSSINDTDKVYFCTHESWVV